MRSTLGISCLVEFGGRVARVPTFVLAALRSREDPVTGLHVIRKPTLQPGAPVHITAGAFEGMEAIFGQQAAHSRVLVLLSLLGRETQVQIDADLVVAQLRA